MSIPIILEVDIRWGINKKKLHDNLFQNADIFFEFMDFEMGFMF